MRLAASLLLSVACTGFAAAQTPDAAIRHVIAQYAEARKSGDAHLLSELLTADVDQLVSSGEWRRGREEAIRGMLASSKTEGSRSIIVENIRLTTPDAAIANARYELQGTNGGPLRKMWSTFVLSEQNGHWRIAAIRNMLPAAPAPTK